MSNTPFRWDHEALDRVCRELPEFGAALFVAENQADFDFLWKQAETSLIPGATASGMAVEHFLWDTAEKERQKENIHTHLIDAAFVRVNERKDPGLSAACEELAIWPCGLVVFAAKSPDSWYDLFDFRVTFRDGTAEIQHADGKPNQEHPCPLLRGGESRTEGTAVVGLLGIEPGLAKTLEAVLRKEGIGTKQIQEDLTSESVPAALLSSSWQLLERRKFTVDIAERTTLCLLGTAQMRQEDRIAAYRGGASLVLPPDADQSEITAALLAQLNIRRSAADPFQKLDESFSILSQRVKRDIQWKTADLDRASHYYQPLLDILMRRSLLTRSPVGALMMPLPTPPEIPSGKGWSRILVQNVVNSLIGSVRPRDVTLIVENKLVVIAHPMNGMTERSLLRRLEHLTRELEQEPAKPKLVQSHVPAGANATADEAKRFLAEIFSASGI